MSVWSKKRADGATYWVYEFQRQGRRFFSPLGGYETRRKAEAAENERKERVRSGKEDQRDDLSLDEAAGLYWQDVGQHHKGAETTYHAIQTVLRLIGPHTNLSKVRTATVNDAVQRRRQELVVNAAAKKGEARAAAEGRKAPARKTPKTLAPATVNREIVEVLRPIINHAAEMYELALPRIAWAKVKLKVEGEVQREFSAAEIEAWVGALTRWVDQFFLGLALTYGPRFGELFCPPDAVKASAAGDELALGRWKGRKGVWKTTRKDGSLHRLPIEPEHARVLSYLAEKAKAAGLDTIWFDEDVGDEGGRSTLTEITYWGMHRRLKLAAKRAGIEDMTRLIHGMRHHAGTTILRRTGNLVLAQRLLGHKKVTTTQRYAHVANADLRAGIEAVSRQGPEALTRALPKPEEKSEDS